MNNQTITIPLAMIRQWMAFINENLPCKFGNPLLNEMQAIINQATTPPAQPAPVAPVEGDTGQQTTS